MIHPFPSPTERRGGGVGRRRGSERAPVRGGGILLGGFLLWLVLVTVWLTWTPFEFGQLRNPIRVFARSALPDLVGNLALLMPVGVAVALGPWRHPLRAALAVGVVLSAGIECGQIFLPGRIASLTDLLLNGAGAALAGAAALRLRDRFGAGPILLAVAAAVYAAIAAQTLYAGSVFREGVRLEAWDPSFGIAAGDEVGADRQYQGRVWSASICAGAGAMRECAGPGADLATRERLVAAAERSQAVGMSARVISASDAQRGPTRIVTFSRGGYDRNLTLGQEGTALVIRVRTPLMGHNGKDFEIRIPDAVRAGTPTALRTGFRRGTVRTDITTAGGTRTVEHRFDALSGGILLRGVVELTPVLMRVTRALAALILTVPPLLLLAALAATRPRGLAPRALAGASWQSWRAFPGETT